MGCDVNGCTEQGIQSRGLTGAFLFIGGSADEVQYDGALDEDITVAKGVVYGEAIAHGAGHLKAEISTHRYFPCSARKVVGAE